MGGYVSKGVFDYLQDHMLDIHRKKMSIISAYTLDYDSYTAKLNFMNSYIKGIEAFLENTVADGDDTEIPFAILGSTVCLRNEATRQRAYVKIVLPKDQASQNAEGVKVYACFSDWGHALLLKAPGERIKAGHASEEYVVEQIEMSM
jgi:transcription elongation GreA/GreB family factor